MTRKFFLIAGVATLALTSPVSAERRGQDREGRAQASESSERKAQRSQRAERPQRAERQRVERQGAQRAERPQRAERQRLERQSVQRERPQRVERQSFQRAERSQRAERQRVERPQRIERQSFQRAERPHRAERQRVERVERPQRLESQRIERAERAPRIQRQPVQKAERRTAERLELRQAFNREDRNRVSEVRLQREGRRELPARFVARDDRQLARVFNDRPMRTMKIREDRRIIAIGDRIDPARFSSAIPTVYRTRYFDTPDYYYRYDDDLGYLYQVDRDDDFVRALIPLFGGYGVGDPWPSTYYSSYVPLGYRSLYYDTPDYYYRSDGYGIYRVDAGTQLIAGLVALLSGQGFGVGQMLPSSYGVYNVPMAYRSTYYDRDDAWYRYGDGFIYEVDPFSRRIDARYPIYSAGYDYMVGQPWPVAYPGYNVPLAYRPLYYDTPQYQYRYANGGIYQVDPTTQVIQALVALVSGQQFAVGQPLPAGYSSYNVPLAYRDRYYDTDDAWYRYADGYVYQVNPATGLIEETVPIYV